jgi:hypothetical protein
MVNDKLVRVPAPSTLHVMLGRLTTEVDVLLATDVKSEDRACMGIE